MPKYKEVAKLTPEELQEHMAIADKESAANHLFERAHEIITEVYADRRRLWIKLADKHGLDMQENLRINGIEGTLEVSTNEDN
jgi:hypothetical protein